MFRRVLIVTPATAVLLAAVPIRKVDAKSDNITNCSQFMCKRTDLPLYSPLNIASNVSTDTDPPKRSALHDTIESGVRTVRIEVQKGYKSLADQMSSVDTFIETAKAHTMSTIDYLNEPQNVLPRSGAIAIGGLSGFIFAARGGFIKKVVYTTIGAGAIASLCYPREAEQFARDALTGARKGYAIVYNFVKGVKPGDEISNEPISKFPTSLEDVKFFFYDLYDEAKEAIFGKKK